MELRGKFKTFKISKTEKSASLEIDGELYYYSSRDSITPDSEEDEVVIRLRGSFFSIKPLNKVLSASDALALLKSLKKKEQ